MLKSRNNFIRNYLSVSLTEQHMATLAGIIKDVDKDVKGERSSLRVHVNLKMNLYEGLSTDQDIHVCRFMLGFSSGSSDEEFASALYHFNHSLVTSDLPSPALQVCRLCHCLVDLFDELNVKLFG